jgi:hypothetical protein
LQRRDQRRHRLHIELRRHPVTNAEASQMGSNGRPRNARYNSAVIGFGLAWVM